MSQPVPSNPSLRRERLPELLRGEVPLLRVWLEEFQTGRLVFCLVVSVLGTALFGAAMGWWRAPRQALYSAIKFPRVILLTTLCNGLINALLAPLLGVRHAEGNTREE